MLWYCLWAALLPATVLGQSYYINFVFNNNRYNPGHDSVHHSKEVHSRESESESQMSVESISKEHSHVGSHEKHHKPSTTKYHSPSKLKENEGCADIPSNTDEECEESGNVSESEIMASESTMKLTIEPTPTPIEITTTTTIETTESTNQSKEPIEQSTIKWLLPTPHPSEFFDYPQAKCHEELDLHELFGIPLAKDRGLPSKVLCEFNNDWGGPWLLMNRMELPTRIHMRHWFFGYITEDYKDMNINFLALAHIINNMRLAMLIIGQDNNNQMVYNLYDDFVMSGFNDLFMLRKAHLVEANTTDLLFISIGEVLISDTGRNRSCPFRVLGAWWGPKWDEFHQGFCVFPVERDIHRPGYIAFFIKPSPFEVNNTAFYSTGITTRRPWASTIDPTLMAKANNDRFLYDTLKEEDFLRNKMKVKDELQRREGLYKAIETRRRDEEKN
ncbi:hypothetical protein ACLKA7_003008 [Drosophila subpalustris]